MQMSDFYKGISHSEIVPECTHKDGAVRFQPHGQSFVSYQNSEQSYLLSCFRNVWATFKFEHFIIIAAAE